MGLSANASLTAGPLAVWLAKKSTALAEGTLFLLISAF